MLLVYIITAYVAAYTVLFLHEIGHYLAARWQGLHVNVLRVGAGPGPIWTRAGTEYHIGLLPVSGVTNVDLEEWADGRPLRASAAPRIWIALAGPAMSLGFAALAFGALIANGSLAADHDARIAYVTDHLLPSGTDAWKALGEDRIVRSVNGSRITSARELEHVLKFARETHLDMTTDVHADLRLPLPSVGSEARRRLLRSVVIGQPARVGTPKPGSAAEAAGFTGGEVILTVDGEPVATFERVERAMALEPGRVFHLTARNGGDLIEREIVPQAEVGPHGLMVGASGLRPARGHSAPKGDLLAIWQGAQASAEVPTTMFMSLAASMGQTPPPPTPDLRKLPSVHRVLWFMAFASSGIGFILLLPFRGWDGGIALSSAVELLGYR